MRKLALLFFCLLLTACNMPAASSSNDDLNSQAATIVAMTLAAQNTPTRENTPMPTPMSTLAVTGTPTPTITPTYSVPMLTINETTNCRTGPGQSFDVLVALLPGASVEIVGRYPTNNYWVVKVEGMDQTCWLWGEYASTTGSVWAVPSVTPPATATAPAPDAPSNLRYTFSCTLAGSVTTSLTWDDNFTDELGYRVYRDGTQIAELPPNSQSFSETITINPGDSLTYGVAAFNNAGTSAQKTISFSCQ